MVTVTGENFHNGVYNDLTPIPNYTVVIVDYGSYQIELESYSGVEINEEAPEFFLSLQEFRDNLGFTAKVKLDSLKNNIEDDVIFMELCPNCTMMDIDAHRDVIRIILTDFYINLSGVNIHNPKVVAGLAHLVTVGLLTQTEVDNLNGVEGV